MAALEKYYAGPRALLVQLCLALSGLALQFPAWENPVQDMIDTFGRNPVTVPTLLQFLTVLPEELTGNTRIPMTVRSYVPSQGAKLIVLQDDEYRTRAEAILTANADTVVELLSMYIQAQGRVLKVVTVQTA